MATHLDHIDEFGQERMRACTNKPNAHAHKDGAQQPVAARVTDEMIAAYLAAQKKYVLDRDHRMVEGDPQAACKAGLQAALAIAPMLEQSPEAAK